MNDVYVRGCERAFLGPGLDRETTCPTRDSASQIGAGDLVIHIRSGHLMTRFDDGVLHYPPYGQVF